jgi:hypothetical protein
VEGGALSCSLHNPAVRGPQLDGRWLEFSPIAIPTTGGVLRWRARMDYDAGTGLAQGEQVYDELDRDARSVAHVELPVRFRLVGKQTTWLAIGLALPLFESGITAETGFSAQTALFNAANFALGLETLSPTGVTPTAG